MTDTIMALMKPKALNTNGKQQKLEPWIETFTGKQFYFLDPKSEQIDIRDIAHALAYTCRYTGHCNRFYSVAEHSIYVSYLAHDPLAGLLHDASEAYITDIASPIKPYLGGYEDMEYVIMALIAAKFGFNFPLDRDIKDCDNTQLKTEAKYLLRSKGSTWIHNYPTTRKHGIAPQCMSPEQAEKAFLQRFDEVRNDYIIRNEFDNQSVYPWRTYGSRNGVFFVEDVPIDPRSLRSTDNSGEGDSSGERGKDSRLGYTNNKQSSS